MISMYMCIPNQTQFKKEKIFPKEGQQHQSNDSLNKLSEEHK